ncbi:MAG: hypothetical protein U0002_11650 [Thermoanaerobaculia bacterium]
MPEEPTPPLEQDPEAWQRLGQAPGQCRTCQHARLLASARSTFLRCSRSDTDPRFPRYPGLPVRGCEGYEAYPSSEQA